MSNYVKMDLTRYEAMKEKADTLDEMKNDPSKVLIVDPQKHHKFVFVEKSEAIEAIEEAIDNLKNRAIKERDGLKGEINSLEVKLAEEEKAVRIRDNYIVKLVRELEKLVQLNDSIESDTYTVWTMRRKVEEKIRWAASHVVTAKRLIDKFKTGSWG